MKQTENDQDYKKEYTPVVGIKPYGKSQIKPLHRAIESIFSRPLQEAARETLSRELRTGISNEKLADLVLALHEEDRLCVHEEDTEIREPRIIYSLGIKFAL